MSRQYKLWIRKAKVLSLKKVLLRVQPCRKPRGKIRWLKLNQLEGTLLVLMKRVKADELHSQLFKLKMKELIHLEKKILKTLMIWIVFRHSTWGCTELWYQTNLLKKWLRKLIFSNRRVNLMKNKFYKFSRSTDVIATEQMRYSQTVIQKDVFERNNGWIIQKLIHKISDEIIQDIGCIWISKAVNKNLCK